jgi:hypothetical protein
MIFKKLCVFAFLFSLLSFASSKAFAGPFGFDYGMSKQQVIQLVGRGGVKSFDERGNGVWMVLTTAPRPNKAFESYSLAFSPSKGLVKIFAVGKDIDTSSDGEQLKSAFNDLHGGLVKAFGAAEDFDYLKSGSIWTEDGEFMQGLRSHDRTLESFWTAKGADGLRDVMLRATASDRTTGYLTLSYEFNGWDELADQIQSKEDSTLR